MSLYSGHPPGPITHSAVLISPPRPPLPTSPAYPQQAAVANLAGLPSTGRRWPLATASVTTTTTTAAAAAAAAANIALQSL
jgi:hypothetical protein